MRWPASTVPPPAPLALWPLLLLAGLLPAAASLLALGLSIRLELVPACNPFIEGCVSVSRAARQGLPNTLFRALVLPAAVLQALGWVFVARGLLAADSAAGEGRAQTPLGLRALAGLGIAAAVALVLYGAFLGTEGAAYRVLRRYGTVVYFGFSCLCLLITGAAMQRLQAAQVPGLPRALQRAIPTLLALLLGLGLVNLLAAPWLAEPWKDRVQNLTEWWGSLLLTGAFVALALQCRQARLGIAIVGLASCAAASVDGEAAGGGPPP